MRLYPIVSMIVAIQLIVFLLINFGPYQYSLFHLMAGSNYYIREGEYWRFVTPIFTHQGFLHLLFNSFSLVLFAPALERILGKVKFLIGYLGAGIIADIATYLMLPLDYVHIGASGAIFGLFGIYLYLMYSRKEYFSRADSQILLIFLIINLGSTFISNESINVLGHLFGLVGGAALAPLLMAFVPRRR
ncbi:rhomboid family intramembrane serine protease [Fictibacillus sp. Mic-4]|uniref:rhomboid family intramembrane serine protease n=1 Tax=Fictibacillus sp. Mic-4 TaxID=3132826 RepID=UPI003CEF9393